MLQASLRRYPLYMEKGLACGQQTAPTDRRTTRAFQCPPALGQTVYDAASASAIALPEVTRVSTVAALLRSTRQIPQCVPGHIHLWSKLISGWASKNTFGCCTALFAV